MPLFKRKPQPAPPIPPDALRSGEEVERSVKATLLQGKAAINGGLYMTNRRLLFHAGKGDARWLIVPYGEVKSTGIYAAPTATMGAPGVRAHCLFIETTKGEHVWWDFHDDEERAWLPIVQERASAATADEAED